MINQSHKGRMRDLEDRQLLQEWGYWNEKLNNATSWGAAVTAALEFRKEAQDLLRQREIFVIEPSSGE